MQGGNGDDPPTGQQTVKQQLAPAPLAADFAAADRGPEDETWDLEDEDNHDGDDTLPASELT